MHVDRSIRHWFGAVAFTVLLMALIALAIADLSNYLFAIMLGMIALAVGFFFLLFPGSQFFTLALANYLSVYSCIYIYLSTANFGDVEPVAAQIGYIMPILAFLFGVVWKRREIRTIVTVPRLREQRHFGRVMRWTVPLVLIGALTFMLPWLKLSPADYDTVFLVLMAAVAIVVFFASHDIAVFLLDTGLLFESFFQRTAQLAVPTFAFLTFYSMNIIVFAALYRIIDRFSNGAHFTVAGQLRDITFPEALYFSVITLRTVGYGEITPFSDSMRVLTSIQIVLGVLLLLFGFSEIMSYSREKRQPRDR